MTEIRMPKDHPKDGPSEATSSKSKWKEQTQLATTTSSLEQPDLGFALTPRQERLSLGGS